MANSAESLKKSAQSKKNASSKTKKYTGESKFQESNKKMMADRYNKIKTKK